MSRRAAGRIAFAARAGIPPGRVAFSAALLFAVLLSAASCAGRAVVHPRGGLCPVSDALERRLRASVAGWVGTPYCIGGTGTPCIDCSGFVRRIYQNVFSAELPRTAEEIRRTGDPVPPGPLTPGDLLVYRISSRRLHVGVYLGHGEFAHASSSKGVMISGIRDRYWTRRFLEARRVI